MKTILLMLIVLLSGCSNTNSVYRMFLPDGSSLTTYRYTMPSKFGTMKQCLKGVRLLNGYKELYMITDNYSEVFGYIVGDKSRVEYSIIGKHHQQLLFDCEVKITGTDGLYYKGWYDKLYTKQQLKERSSK